MLLIAFNPAGMMLLPAAQPSEHLSSAQQPALCRSIALGASGSSDQQYRVAAAGRQSTLTAVTACYRHTVSHYRISVTRTLLAMPLLPLMLAALAVAVDPPVATVVPLPEDDSSALPAGSAPPAPPAAVMPNLLLPSWQPTYNLTQSTMTQLCFGPFGNAPKLDAQTGAFLKQWGVVALDFESQENTWAHHSPKDADLMMIEQAAAIKAMAPETQVWVYRNLVQPYSNFVQLREKIEDPQFAGWFVHFDNATNDEALTPRCETNPRLNKVRNAPSLSTSLGKNDGLPRQARDKHRETSNKQDGAAPRRCAPISSTPS